MTRRTVTTLRGAAIGLGAVVLGAVAIVVAQVSLDKTAEAQSAGPIPSLPIEVTATATGTASDPVAGPTDAPRKTKLGVFEPIRGWIVYPIGDRLEAVNPADPAERHTLQLPEELDALIPPHGRDGGNRPSPAGWTADGTKLALWNEYSGDKFVMSADGSIARADAELAGCCAFVPEPWLSPDGRFGLEGVSRSGIRFVEQATGEHRLRRLEPPNTGEWARAAWSTDGSRIAFAETVEGMEPALHVADFATGANRIVATLDAGHVRHVVWSPDDSQLLVVAGEPLPQNASLNPMVYPQRTSLYLVETDGSGVREIASGYYVATAWSPDGTRIAAIEYGRLRQLVVMNADGSRQRVLVDLPSGELFTGLAWHPLPGRS